MSASDSLLHVGSNVPSWLTLLDELLGKISSRQAELSKLDDFAEKKSMRPRGSTESLRPADNEDPGHENYSPMMTDEQFISSPLGTPDSPPKTHPNCSLPGPSPENGMKIPGVQKPTLAQAARRKRKTTSIISGASGPSKWRTRSMIIVYYDSQVQEAFEILVRNISTARNMIRKGKMAARMQAITDKVDSDDASPFSGFNEYTRMRRPRGEEGKTVYDMVDAGLEFAQSTCETGAHQFLRDGDCSDEIEAIRKRLIETRHLADEQAVTLQEQERAKAAAAAAAEQARREKEEQDAAARTEEASGVSVAGSRKSRKSSDTPKGAGLIEVDSDSGTEEEDYVPLRPPPRKR